MKTMGVIFGTLKLPPRKEKYKLITKDVVDSADVCIIGSGAAGAVLAKELVDAGKKVVLIERGGYFEGQDMNQRDAEMMPLLWKNAGFQFDDDLKIAVAQGTCLGGSTIINDAVCFDPPKRIREQWKKMGVNFTEQEWRFHTNRVNKMLSVSQVTPDELNLNNQMLMVGATKLGLSEHRPNNRNCVNCMQCGFCHLGCHYETKQDVLVTYIHKALQKPDEKIRVYCNCYVDKLVHSDGIVQGIEGHFRDAANNNTYRIRVNAKVVIVSAGAIASSKLLLRNGIAQKTAGVGVCLHPAPFVIGDFEIEIKGNQGIPMAYTVHDFGITRSSDKVRKKFGFDEDGEFLLESIFLPMLQFSMAIPGDPIEHNRLLGRFNNYAMAGILIRDDNSGRVSLTPTGRASLRYKLSKKDLKTISHGIEVLAKMWFKMNAKKVIVSHRKKTILHSESEIPELLEKILNDPDNLLLGSAHPQSGNRIGPSPASSVVDSDCRVHGFENLFVCDASVFPTSLGVNPQITVMVVASIVASRIAKQWKRYSRISLQKSRGQTCSISQPMYCLRKNLSDHFDSIDSKYGADMLINSVTEKPDDSNWNFDKTTLEITNDTHWKGIFPRDTDIPNVMTMYFGGFWKRFGKNPSNTIDGITHPFETPVFAKNKATTRNLSGFGKVVLLEYLDFPYNQFFDVLKFVDKNTILGKAFFGTPQLRNEILTFSMSRKYPFEFMTEEDHERLYAMMKKPTLDKMVGIWEGYLISDSAWSPPVFRFRYYFDSDGSLKNHYLFGNILSGTATVHDKADHVEMHDETGGLFHDEIRQVNNDILIGKYYSQSNEILNLIPRDISFLHADPSQPRLYLPYVLKRVGEESAFREYT